MNEVRRLHPTLCVPLVVAARGNDAATFGKSGAERRLGVDGLEPGVDHPRSDRRILGP